MLKQHLVIVVILFFVLYSCGGVIGTIKKYEFKGKSIQQLEQAINKTYLKNPDLKKPNSDLYGENAGNSYYFFIKEKNNEYIIKCNLIKESQGVGVEISLTTGAEWGEIMRLSSNMSFKEKRKFKTLFKEHVLPKLKEELD